jgi:hypothetical protein
MTPKKGKRSTKNEIKEPTVMELSPVYNDKDPSINIPYDWTFGNLV